MADAIFTVMTVPAPAVSPAQAAAATGLPAGTPVILGGHDFLCGMLPVGAFKPGVVLDVMGTWDIVTVAIEQPVLTPAVQRMGYYYWKEYTTQPSAVELIALLNAIPLLYVPKCIAPATIVF